MDCALSFRVSEGVDGCVQSTLNQGSVAGTIKRPLNLSLIHI